MNASPSTSLLDLSLNEDQQAIADAIDRFCESRCDAHIVKGLANSFSSPLWRELAEMGVFMPATPDGDGGALEVCAISEALGRHVFPGPLAATFVATQILNDDERLKVIEGHSVVSLGNIDHKKNNQQLLMPFAEQANLFLLTDGLSVYRAEPMSTITPVKTLGGEPWGRVDMKVNEKCAASDRGLLLNQISLSAYLAAAGKQLVKETSDYANVRKQFGKVLGDFQAVSHPLADCLILLTAAENLARAAACCFDANDLSTTKNYSNSAHLSASRAALKAAYVCHQIYAGIGITLEGPAFHFSRRIRQLVSQPPGERYARENLLKQIDLGTKT